MFLSLIYFQRFAKLWNRDYPLICSKSRLYFAHCFAYIFIDLKRLAEWQTTLARCFADTPRWIARSRCRTMFTAARILQSTQKLAELTVYSIHLILYNEFLSKRGPLHFADWNEWWVHTRVWWLTINLEVSHRVSLCQRQITRSRRKQRLSTHAIALEIISLWDVDRERFILKLAQKCPSLWAD